MAYFKELDNGAATLQHFPMRKSALLLFAILLVLIGTGVYMLTSLRTDPIADMLANDELIKILFVITDGNEALTTNVFFYYSPFKRGALFTVPGNTGAIYASLNRVDRIDTIYAQRGLTAYHDEIEKLLNQTIHFDAVITLDHLCELADLLGGLRAFISHDVDVTGANGERYLLPSGAITLDGDKTRAYVTYALADESISDMQMRRQNVMVSLISALNENKTLIRRKDVFKRILPLVSINLDRADTQHLFTELAEVNADRLVPQSIAGQTWQVDGQSLLFPLYDGQLIKDVVWQAVNSMVSPTETNYSRVFALEVLNGTTTQGLARNTAILLQGIGFDVPSTGNAPSNDVARTVIINHIGNGDVAKNLGDFLRCTNIVTEEVRPETEGTDVGASVDYTIIIGRDFDGRYVR